MKCVTAADGNSWRCRYRITEQFGLERTFKDHLLQPTEYAQGHEAAENSMIMDNCAVVWLILWWVLRNLPLVAFFQLFAGTTWTGLVWQTPIITLRNPSYCCLHSQGIFCLFQWAARGAPAGDAGMRLDECCCWFLNISIVSFQFSFSQVPAVKVMKNQLFLKTLLCQASISSAR